MITNESLKVIEEIQKQGEEIRDGAREVAIKRCQIIALTSELAHRKAGDHKGAEVCSVIARKIGELLQE